MKHGEHSAVRVGGAELDEVRALESERAKHARDAWGVARGYATFEAMFGDDGLDAIFIASSFSAHGRQIGQALDAGFRVFSEKTLVVSTRGVQGGRAGGGASSPPGVHGGIPCAAMMLPLAGQSG